MSIHNRYADVPLTEEDFTIFDAQFAIIEEIMKALPEPDGRILRRVAKLGLKSDTFTRDALMLAAHHEELLPRGLDVQELEAQVRVRDELKSRALQMKLMARKMEKIVQLLGSDVFSGALAAYKAMKTNHRGTLNEQLRELGRIFRRKKKDEEEGGSVEGPETRDEHQRQHAMAREALEEGTAIESSELDLSLGTAGSGAALTEADVPASVCERSPCVPPRRLSSQPLKTDRNDDEGSETSCGRALPRAQHDLAPETPATSEKRQLAGLKRP